jgi:hypothetical protein
MNHKNNMWKKYLGISYNNILGFIWFEFNYLLEEPNKYGLQHVDSITLNKTHIYKTLEILECAKDAPNAAETIIDSIKIDENA